MRLAHVIAGVRWLREVVTINFVLVPALLSAKTEERQMLLSTVFPRVFRLATHPRRNDGGERTRDAALVYPPPPAGSVQSEWGWFIFGSPAFCVVKA